MKMILIGLLITISNPLKAYWEEDCFREGELYGRQNFVSPQCQEFIIKETQIKAEDEGSTLFAWRNIYILSFQNKKYLVSGNMSLLRDIVSIDLDMENNKIAVLNRGVEGAEIYLFKAKRSGNISPSKIISSPLLNEANSIKFTVDGNLISHGEQHRYEWSLAADYRVSGQARPID